MWLPKTSRSLALLVFGGLEILTPRALPAAAPPSGREYARQLEKEERAATGQALTAFFRRHTPTPADARRIPILVRNLGSDVFEEREQASAALVRLGPAALGAVRSALHSPGAEVRRRAKDCLEKIRPEVKAITAAARQLSEADLPPKAPGVLLAYLPFAPSDEVQENLRMALLVHSGKAGVISSSLLSALRDREPSRRAAAGFIVGQVGTPEQRRRVFTLLEDGDPRVRLFAAEGLLAGMASNSERQDDVRTWRAWLKGPRGRSDRGRIVAHLRARQASITAMQRYRRIELTRIHEMNRRDFGSYIGVEHELERQLRKVDRDLALVRGALRLCSPAAGGDR